MLNQAAGDRAILAKQLNISPQQMKYVTHTEAGEGLIFYGNVVLPFVDRFPKDTELYQFSMTAARVAGVPAPGVRVRVGVPVPGSLHSREKRRFAVGLRRGRGMLRYLCGGVFKALSLGKLRQRHALDFPVLRVGLLFQCSPGICVQSLSTRQKEPSFPAP